MSKIKYWIQALIGVLVIVPLLLLALTGCPSSSSPYATTSTPTGTASPSVSPSITASPSVSASPSRTASPSVSASPSITGSPTASASPSASATGAAVTIDITAQNIAFDKKSVTVPVGSKVTINFNNKDSGIAHNFAVYTDSSATKSIFVGQIITGPATITYTFTAPTTPGTYFFRCDVHPTQITGQFIVQ